MRVVIIYESFFGNTRKIAEAISNAVSSRCEVELIQVKDFKPELLHRCDLLIVGSPTRAFRPTPAISECLKSLPGNLLTGIQVAAFDTRIPENSVNGFVRMLMKLFGYAAKPLANFLTEKGGLLLASPEGFLVSGTEGPLLERELERAGAWGNHLIHLLSEKRKL